MIEETLFHAALAKPPGERAAFLDQACADRTELRAAVAALLAAHEAAADMLDRPAAPTGVTVDSEPGEQDCAAASRPTAQPDEGLRHSATTDYRPVWKPDVVIAGRYTLVDKIGEGGMGEVWVAKQTDPVKRKVALKLIKTGMDSKAVLARFEQERQALAMMDHPNIARVLDGGMTPAGQPFFVMELVNGLPLTRYCDEAELTPKERLELFVPICQAVQHAHQKGIVHRDLKPANILITMIDARPVPKVIDFGVAKATAGKLTDESMSTQFGAVVGTFEYMSPEQAGFSGIDIDTRADIYSLGVILYELLTGLRPIDAKRLKKAALSEMIRIIQEEEPSKPSTRLSTDESLPSLAALRQTEPRKLMTMLRGELDWVVMKCLEKSRDRRYETASALSRDIQRYLADEPVEARPPSAGYRLKKFVRRNKVQVVAASLVLIALVGGMIGTTYGLFRAKRAAAAERIAKRDAVAKREEAEKQQARAEDREQQAIEAVKRFRDAVAENPELKHNPSLESLRKMLLKEPLAFFKALRGRLQADRDTRPESLERLAAASFDLGVLTDEIGDQQDAVIAYREALALTQKLADDYPTDTRIRANLAVCHSHLAARLSETGQPVEAEAELRKAIVLQQQLADDNPDVTNYRSGLAGSHSDLGDVLAATGRPAEAEAEYRRAIKLSQRVTEENRTDSEHRQFLATHHHNLGILLSDTGKSAEAEAEYRTAIALRQQLADDNLADINSRSRLADSHVCLSSLKSDTGNQVEAEAELRQALAIYQKLADENPAVTEFRSRIALTHYNLHEYPQALAIYQKLTDDNPAVTEFRRYLAASHNNLGILLNNTGKPAEAEAELRKALAIKQKLADENPSVTEFRSELAGTHHGLGQVLVATGKTAEAEAEYRTAISISQNVTEKNPAITQVPVVPWESPPQPRPPTEKHGETGGSRGRVPQGPGDLPEAGRCQPGRQRLPREPGGVPLQSWRPAIGDGQAG
jgi:serine/threonine protein kinase/tetratricopeptide (TPR) repeat protein